MKGLGKKRERVSIAVGECRSETIAAPPKMSQKNFLAEERRRS